MVTRCVECGKRFGIPYPHLYVYRYWGAVNRFFCSWKCLRAKERKEQEMTYVDNQQRLDDLLDRLNAVMSIRAALADMGYTGKSIGPVYRSIRAYAEDKQPDALEMLPENMKAAEEQPAVVKVDGPIRIETETPEQVEIKAAKITKPLNYEGLEVSAVRHPDLGEFYFDKKYNSIDWRTPEGDEVSLGPFWWKKMLADLPTILKVLGVDPDE